MDDKKRFVQNLIEQREKQGLTPQQLADMAAIPLENLESLESGHEQPLMDTLVRLAGSLEVSVDDLLA